MFGRESMPNCVPEMYREQFEREGRAYELRENAAQRYEENRKRLRVAISKGFPTLDYGGYSECYKCESKDSQTQRGKDDDFDIIICLNPKCECHKKYGTEMPHNSKNVEELAATGTEKDTPYSDRLKKLELLDGVISVTNVKKFAMANYKLGGDTIVECMEDNEIQKLVDKKGKTGIIDMMYLNYSQWLDIQSTIW